MLESLVADAGALGADYLLAAGDISAEAVPSTSAEPGSCSTTSGRIAATTSSTRGNHDRAHAGDAYASVPGRPVAGQRLLPRPVLPGRRADVLHPRSPGPAGRRDRHLRQARQRGDAGALSTDQLAWFRAELAKDRDQPTLVFGHHPLVVEDSPFPVSPSNTLDATQAAAILGDYARTPGHVPAPCRAHSPQQAHHQPAGARRHASGDRRRQGVSRRLLAPPPVHRGLRAELLQVAAATSPGNGANEAGRRSRALAAVRARQQRPDRNTVVERDLSNLRPVRR